MTPLIEMQIDLMRRVGFVAVLFFVQLSIQEETEMERQRFGRSQMLKRKPRDARGLLSLSDIGVSLDCHEAYDEILRSCIGNCVKF